MTQTSNRIFDEFAKIMTDAAGAAHGVKKEIETIVKGQAERILNDMDVVKRDDFEAFKAMAQKTREENELLKQRIEKLEEILSERT